MKESELRKIYKKAQIKYEKLSLKDKLFVLIRTTLCDGSTDCENDPCCPEGTDGCMTDDILETIYPLIEKQLSQKDEQIKELVEIINMYKEPSKGNSFHEKVLYLMTVNEKAKQILEKYKGV